MRAPLPLNLLKTSKYRFELLEKFYYLINYTSKIIKKEIWNLRSKLFFKFLQKMLRNGFNKEIQYFFICIIDCVIFKKKNKSILNNRFTPQEIFSLNWHENLLKMALIKRLIFLPMFDCEVRQKLTIKIKQKWKCITHLYLNWH